MEILHAYLLHLNTLRTCQVLLFPFVYCSTHTGMQMSYGVYYHGGCHFLRGLLVISDCVGPALTTVHHLSYQNFLDEPRCELPRILVSFCSCLRSAPRVHDIPYDELTDDSYRSSADLDLSLSVYHPEIAISPP